MKIGIIGLGAIGASFAWALTRAGHNEVYGHDIDKKTMAKAMERDFIRDFYIDPKKMLAQMDLVFITLYPSQIGPYFAEHLEDFKENAIVSDVSGVKQFVIDQVRPSLAKRPDLDFVFAHPMRGSEKAGIIGADYLQFLGANALITPIPENREGSLRLIETLYHDMGFSLVTRVDVQNHDAQIAYVSQLMHVLAVAAVNSAQSTEQTMTYAGNTFQELTRVANINIGLWKDLFMKNRHALLDAMDHFKTEFDRIYDTLEDESMAGLDEIFRASSSRREQWYDPQEPR